MRQLTHRHMHADAAEFTSPLLGDRLRHLSHTLTHELPDAACTAINHVRAHLPQPPPLGPSLSSVQHSLSDAGERLAGVLAPHLPHLPDAATESVKRLQHGVTDSFQVRAACSI